MITEHISTLFLKTFGTACKAPEMLPASGSNRTYYRAGNENLSAIAAVNPVKKENDAFFHLTAVFCELGLPVPKLYATDPVHDIYLIEDLGDTTVFDACNDLRKQTGGMEAVEKMFQKILDDLIRFQTLSCPHIDFSKAYPRHSFDRQSIMWDLNYFKYYFLKVFYIPFDEQLLEDDFNSFADYLDSAAKDFFMYRDFQSRNIMLKDDKIYYIDYQGGRRGPLHYDPASMLYSAKTDLPQDMRDRLLKYYIKNLSASGYPTHAAAFETYYYAFVLVRQLQALGAYGYRGVFEQKQHFIQSIPPAVHNLSTVMGRLQLPVHMPELMDCLQDICRNEKFSL